MVRSTADYDTQRLAGDHAGLDQHHRCWSDARCVCCFGYSSLTHLPASNRFHGTFYCGTEPQSQLPLRHASELEQVLLHYRVHRSERGAPRTGCQFCRLCESSSVCFVRLPSFAAWVDGYTFFDAGVSSLTSPAGTHLFPHNSSASFRGKWPARCPELPIVLDIPSPAVSARDVE